MKGELGKEGGLLKGQELSWKGRCRKGELRKEGERY